MIAGDSKTVLLVNPGADLYGSDRMTLESVRALVRAEHRVFVTVPGPGPLVDLLIEAGATVIQQPMPILRKSLVSPRGIMQLARQSLAAIGPVRRLLKKTDAGTVMVNTITVPFWLLLARTARRRVVCHVHEAERSIPTLVRWAMYLPLACCHRLVVNSEHTAQVLSESSRGLTNRLTVVHNTVTGPSTVEPPRRNLEGPIRLLYVGRLSHRKGPHVAIDALRLLRESGRAAQLVLVGAVFPGHEAYEEHLRAQVAAHGLSDAVLFAGFQSDVWGYLADSDVALVPTTGDESFGNVAVEALLAARPVIVSEVGGLMEATSCATARVTVPPGDARALADAIATVQDDWDRFSGCARVDAVALEGRYASERYSADLLKALGNAEARKSL